MFSGFDRVAHIYRWGEYITFGPFLSRARSAHLSDLATAQHALILGDGDGRFTHLALRTYPQLRVTAIDISEQMLTLLRQRCAPYANRLHTIQADITKTDLTSISSFRPESSQLYRDDGVEKPAVSVFATRTLSPASAPWPPADTVVTHFFLDCLTTRQIETLITQLATPTRWIVSDFHTPTGLLKLPSQAIVRALYAAFRLLTGLRTQTLPDWQQAFHSAGWHLQKHSSFLGSLLITETWQRGETLRTLPASHLLGE